MFVFLYPCRRGGGTILRIPCCKDIGRATRANATRETLHSVRLAAFDVAFSRVISAFSFHYSMLKNCIESGVGVRQGREEAIAERKKKRRTICSPHGGVFKGAVSFLTCTIVCRRLCAVRGPCIQSLSLSFSATYTYNRGF